ncbi:MAG: Glycosyltransferase [Parcubacteria group bacterium GW2011_GWA1_53_13]|nr:MAG: Glycosyltransferase [Parcubacteria group bacterium GW2011_GWA1_53_13]
MDVKKILIFSLAYYPSVGGAEVAIKEITDRIAPEDIEFHMITLRFDRGQARKEKIGNVLVHRVGGGASYFSKILFVPRAALRARALNKTEKFDAAWAMMSYMLFPLVLANLKLPYALTLQEGDTEQYMFGRARIALFLPLLRRGFRNAAAVSALSTFLADWAKHMGYQGKVEVVPNGADVQNFSGSKTPHQGTRLITSSRLVHKNAVDDVLRALVLVPDVRFQIAGAGPEETTLKVLARELGVSDRVEWLGHVDHMQLVALLHAADIYVRPSRSEGFGASFPEAMAAEIPVITTQEGGLKDYITPEVAWPVEKDRPDQIALQIKAILGNPQRTAQVVERARQMVVAKYDWSLLARNMRERVFARLFI